MPAFTTALSIRSKRLANSCYDQSCDVLTTDIKNSTNTFQGMIEPASQVLSQRQNDVKIGEVMENVTKALNNSQVNLTHI